MNFKKLMFVCSLILAAGIFTSCGKGGIDCNNAANEWFQDVNGEFTDFGNALTAYSLDPSAANCNALKASFQDYIDAIRKWEDCLAGDQAWEDAINEAEAEINTIC